MTEHFQNHDDIIWVDSEVHLLPPEYCLSSYIPPPQEVVLRQTIYEHPEREMALPKATVDGLLAEMRATGIKKAIIMGLPWQISTMNWRNTAYIAEVVRQCPDRFIGIGVLPPPTRGNMRDAVCRIAEEYGLRGIKVIPSWQGYRLHDPIFRPALEEMIAHDLVLVPHTDHLFLDPATADTAYSLYEVARRYPDLKIMAPHLGGLLCLYALHPPIRPVLKNILFITSVPTTMPMIMFALESVGPQHLAFGTDFPFNPSHDQYSLRRALEELPLSHHDKRLIAGQNVLRFFGEGV